MKCSCGWRLGPDHPIGKSHSGAYELAGDHLRNIHGYVNVEQSDCPPWAKGYSMTGRNAWTKR